MTLERMAEAAKKLQARAADTLLALDLSALPPTEIIAVFRFAEDLGRTVRRAQAERENATGCDRMPADVNGC